MMLLGGILLVLQGCQSHGASSGSSSPASPWHQNQEKSQLAIAPAERAPIKLIPLAPLPAEGSATPLSFTPTSSVERSPQADSAVTPSGRDQSIPPPRPFSSVEGLEYQAFDLPTSVVHLVRISPQAKVRLSIALSTDLTPVDTLAQMVPGSVVAINAGFFDPNNAHSMNFITQAGQKTADPRQNQRLMRNAGIQPYLDQVLNRSEFRRYQCKAGESRYAIAFRQDPIPKDCQLQDSVGGGPQLLPRLTAVEEAFWAEKQGKVLRDAIGMKRPNARSAIALTAKGEVLLAMAAQKLLPVKSPDSKADSAVKKKTSASASGLSLPDFALFLQGQGAVQALNLDGGSSSGLYLSPETVYGKWDATGQPIRRSVKSVLVVSAQP